MGFSFYKHEYPTGRSNHTCEFCGELIKKGIKYSKEVGKYDGEFFSRCMHIECNNMVMDYCAFDEDFTSYDQVRDYLRENHCVGCDIRCDKDYMLKIPERCSHVRDQYKEIL